MSNFMNNLDLHLEEEYYNGIDTIKEDMFDKDKYLEDIFEYQEIIGDMRNDYEYGELDSVYDDINNIEDIIDDWQEEDFIKYIKYLKDLVGEW